jgi:hypothetical protein
VYRTREQALDRLKQVGLPPVFERTWEGLGPASLVRQWDPPRHWFTFAEQVSSDCPRLARCLPLLESNLDHVIALDETNGEYVEYYYGDPDCETIARSYQQFLSYLFAGFVVSGLVDVVEKVSDEFEYIHLPKLLAWAEVDDDESFEESPRAFVNSIPD